MLKEVEKLALKYLSPSKTLLESYIKIHKVILNTPVTLTQLSWTRVILPYSKIFLQMHCGNPKLMQTFIECYEEQLISKGSY